MPAISGPVSTGWTIPLRGRCPRVLLVEMSRKAYGFGDPFVQIGLVLWIACVAVAEMVVWPGERRLQRLLSGSANWVRAGVDAGGAASDRAADAGSSAPAGAGAPAVASGEIALRSDTGPPAATNEQRLATDPPGSAEVWRTLGVRVALSAWFVCAVLIVAIVLMVQKP